MQPASRLKHIDSLRGIAVLLVLLQHVSERYIHLSPEVKQHSEQLYAFALNLNVGRIGVVIFFAISGFVLLQSIQGDKKNATRRFLVRRFFRLYPVFWLSLILSGFILQLKGESLSTERILANISMLPMMFNQKMISGLYWTLEAELFFYLLGLLLFLLGKSNQPSSIFISSLSVLLIFLIARAIGLNDPEHIGVHLLGFHLSIMFWGALFRQYYNNPDLITQFLGRELPIKSLLEILSLCILSIPFASLIKGIATNEFRFIQFGVANILAMSIFYLFSLSIKINNKWLAWVGAISYSMYLFHPIILTSIYWYLGLYAPAPLRELHLSLYIVVNIIGSIFFSTIIYYVLEKPCIRLSHYFTAAKN